MSQRWRLLWGLYGHWNTTNLQCSLHAMPQAMELHRSRCARREIPRKKSQCDWYKCREFYTLHGIDESMACSSVRFRKSIVQLDQGRNDTRRTNCKLQARVFQRTLSRRRGKELSQLQGIRWVHETNCWSLQVANNSIWGLPGDKSRFLIFLYNHYALPLVFTKEAELLSSYFQPLDKTPSNGLW